MATWRRIAIELFPDREQSLRSPLMTPYSLLADLLPAFRQAVRDDDAATVRRVVAFAEWALRQPENDLRNAAAVSFFEHVFDGPPRYWPTIAEWLSPYVVEQVGGLWALTLSSFRLDDVRRLLARRTRPLHQHVTDVWTGVPP
jgi:hypothetical protein